MTIILWKFDHNAFANVDMSIMDSFTVNHIPIRSAHQISFSESKLYLYVPEIYIWEHGTKRFG